MREPTLVAEPAVPPRARAAGAVAAPELALLLAVTAIAVALRAGGLTFQGLDGDEGYSIALAQRSFADMLALFGYEANGTLYSLLLWPLSRIDDSLAMLRAPAAAAGSLAVPALWWALRRSRAVRRRSSPRSRSPSPRTPSSTRSTRGPTASSCSSRRSPSARSSGRSQIPGAGCGGARSPPPRSCSPTRTRSRRSTSPRPSSRSCSCSPARHASAGGCAGSPWPRCSACRCSPR